MRGVGGAKGGGGMSTVFVDGAYGTVGRALAPHLQALLADGLISKVIRLDEQDRKNVDVRKEAMRAADIVVTCVPDGAAAEAVAMVSDVNPQARVLDASAAHRCEADWLYGLDELRKPEDYRNARFVANPGCFATGCILLGLMVRAGGMRAPHVAFQGATGTSAAGNRAEAYTTPMLTQFGSFHRHLPEIRLFGGVQPALTTMVGPWERGMLVQTTIEQGLDETIERLHQFYDAFPHISILVAERGANKLDVTSCNGTNDVKIMVAGQPYGGISLACVFDNLGKGSAGAAAQNLRRMLGGR